MLRMVKGKYVWLIAFFVATYVVWVAVSGYLQNATTFISSVHDQKVARLQELNQLDAIIVGGSNAVYSLSAERISELSDENWFNAALPREGITIENQSAFLDDVADSIDADKVTTVVISSIAHVRGNLDTVASQETGLGLDGVARSPYWLPSQSLWNLIVDPQRTFPTIISNRGDLVHAGVGLCRRGNRDRVVSWLSDSQIDGFLGTWLPLVRSRFANANVVITIPAQYLEELPDPVDSRAYMDRLQSRIDAWITANPESEGGAVSTVLEPNLDDRAMVCNSVHHLNAQGRLVRTNALYNLMTGVGETDGR